MRELRSAFADFVLVVAVVLVAVLAVVGCAVPLHSAELPRAGKIAAPQPWTPPALADPTPTHKAHNFYLGGMGSYSITPDEGLGDLWHGSVIAGYLWRPNAVLGAGIEAEYMVRDLGHISIDDGVASVRGRAGVFVAPGLFVYGTAGVAEASGAALPGGLRRGPVVGGGVELDVLPNIAVRAEALEFRHADDFTEWGGDGSTVGRVGMVFKF